MLYVVLIILSYKNCLKHTNAHCDKVLSFSILQDAIPRGFRLFDHYVHIRDVIHSLF